MFLIYNKRKNLSVVYVCVFLSEPSYTCVVQLGPCSAAAGALLHRAPALRPPQGAVPGDPHALNYHKVRAHTHRQTETQTHRH